MYIYIGSTCEPTLARRLTKHVGSYKCYLEGTYPYTTSFDIIKNNNYDIILLEKCENITSKDELHINPNPNPIHIILTLVIVSIR